MSVESLTFLVFSFHLFVIYYYSFRFLYFLVSVEVSLVILFSLVCMMKGGNELSYVLIFLSIVACGVSVGLSIMVSWFRYKDKNSCLVSKMI